MALANTKTLNESSLKKHIAKPPKGSVIVTITPPVAAYTLNEINDTNRPFSATKVNNYSEDMQIRNWSLTGETIKFGADGQLKDGQHRLAACVRANTAFDTHAIFGIDPETFQHIDIGKKRDSADTLAIMGVQSYKRASTILRHIIGFEAGLTRPPKTGVSNDWIKSKYLTEIDHDLLQETILVANRIYKTTKWPVGVVGAFFYQAVQAGQREQIEQFLNDMGKGIGPKPRSPIPVMLETVMKLRHDHAFNLRSHHYSVLISRAFHKYKDGKSLNRADVHVKLTDKMVAI